MNVYLNLVQDLVLTGSRMTKMAAQHVNAVSNSFYKILTTVFLSKLLCLLMTYDIELHVYV